jgi:hypothetical protein
MEETSRRGSRDQGTKERAGAEMGKQGNVWVSLEMAMLLWRDFGRMVDLDSRWSIDPLGVFCV